MTNWFVGVCILASALCIVEALQTLTAVVQRLSVFR